VLVLAEELSWCAVTSHRQALHVPDSPLAPLPIVMPGLDNVLGLCDLTGEKLAFLIQVSDS